VLDEYEYEEQSCVLRSGALLVLFTDGVTEAQNDAGELYGMERLASCIASLPVATSAVQAMSEIQDDVARFVAGAACADDLTLLVLRWLGSQQVTNEP
jgi:sigma-B regulation protein RsbU (phosphoserine phosphatase)